MNITETKHSVTLTDQAVAKIKTFFAEDQNLAGKALRVFVESGGCSGSSYGFKFDDANAADIVQSYDGFNVVIDTETEKQITGSIVDYKEDFGHEGFAIQNPNAKKSCGCGKSFSA